MAPKSRGSSKSPAHGLPNPLSAHPTLKPFLDNLPSPTSTISDQRTPTANGYSERAPPASPTPNRPRRATITNNIQDEDASDYDSNLEDDADFQSHYSFSAQNSDSDVSSSPISNPDEIAHPTSPSTSPPHNLHHTTSTQSLPPPPPLPLFPPFYNRPPTPLPPSPSLTSLLRPPSLLNRSTTSTRPTTPDSSDVETPNDTEAAVAQSARRATGPVSRVSPKVPTYEYYGFVLYLASSLAFLLYLLWSYLPSPFLAAIGLHYYPNRWWSLAIPAWLVMLIVFIYVALLSYNVEYLTLPMGSVECIVDEAANIAVVDGRGRLKGRNKDKGSRMDLRASKSNGNMNGGAGWMMNGNGNGNSGNGQRGAGKEKVQWRNLWNEGTDAVMDIPIGGVCEVLYGEGRDPNTDPD